MISSIPCNQSNRKKLIRVLAVLGDRASYMEGMPIFADRTNGRAYSTMLRPSDVCNVICIVPKRCVLEQKLLLAAYRKSFMRNLLVPK